MSLRNSGGSYPWGATSSTILLLKFSLAIFVLNFTVPISWPLNQCGWLNCFSFLSNSKCHLQSKQERKQVQPEFPQQHLLLIYASLQIHCQALSMIAGSGILHSVSHLWPAAKFQLNYQRQHKLSQLHEHCQLHLPVLNSLHYRPIDLCRKPSKPKQTNGTVETYLPVTGGEGDKVKDGDLCCCIPTASLWVKWD